MDCVAALALLLALAPVLGVAMLAVACTSPGPMLHRRRVLGRRPFDAYKLRTMVRDAEVRLINDGQLAAQWDRRAKIAGDPRVTRVGRFLRRWGIDELPQLWNVIRGDMSLVGPRFRTEEEWRSWDAAEERIRSVAPGLTGLWQVSGHHRVAPEERVRLDLEYVARRGFALDLLILLRTPLAVLRMESGL